MSTKQMDPQIYILKYSLFPTQQNSNSFNEIVRKPKDNTASTDKRF